MRVLFPTIIAALVGGSCAALPASQSSSTVTRFQGVQEEIGPPSANPAGSLFLTRRGVLDLAPGTARDINNIELWHGKARLKDGRCLQLDYDQQSLKLIGATLTRDASQCAQLADLTVTMAHPCGADQWTNPAWLWRLGCRRSANGRSIIVAMREKSAGAALPFTLATIDEELLAIGAISIHDHVVIRTVGIRSDGKTVFSDFLWNGRSGADAKPE